MTTPQHREDYLRARLRELYPPPLEVHLPGDPAAVNEPLLTYAALPSARRVRVLVPMRPRHASARSLRLQMSGSRLRTRALRLLLSAAIRSGSLTFTPGVAITISGGGGSVETMLRSQLGVPEIFITMPVGPPRATRKSVLQVTDGHGQPLAYVKVGHDDLTKELVWHEGEVLSCLNRRRWTSIEAPELLGRLEWNDLVLLLMSPLRLPKRRLPGRSARAALISAVEQIARSGSEAVASDDGGRSVRLRLRQHLDGMTTPVAGPLRRELDLLDAEDTAVPVGCWHGDLNPGNLALGTERTAIWDWERFEVDVPLGFDLLHHDLMHDITVVGRDAEPAARKLLASAPQTLSALGLDETAAKAAARLYLLTLAVRYLTDRQSEAGATLGQVDTWLIPALQCDRSEYPK